MDKAKVIALVEGILEEAGSLELHFPNVPEFVHLHEAAKVALFRAKREAEEG